MAAGSLPDVLVTRDTWTNLGQNKIVQWKGGVDVLVYIAATPPANTMLSGLTLSDDVRFLLSTEALDIHVRGIGGNAQLAVAEVTP